MESIDHGGYLTADSPDYEVWECATTYSGPICIAYAYNKCYLSEEKKAVKLMKDTDEHLYG